MYNIVQFNSMCIHWCVVCVHACVRACMHTCLHMLDACVRVHVCVCACLCVFGGECMFVLMFDSCAHISAHQCIQFVYV